MRKLLLVTLAVAGTAHAADVAYDWFEYVGKDSRTIAMLPRGFYRNPILPGYYPDPAVERVGDKYYMVNSTFAHWPGIPIHESTDLVNWKLVGHALTDTSVYSFDGLGTSRGVFAPSIHHHDGTFYVVNTLVDAGGNFVVTAKDPAGPWSPPTWLKNVDGIDPSLMFDDDGKAYLLHNGPPAGKPEYDGHRAIWMHEFDPVKLQAGPGKVLVDKGADPAAKPIWIEGPHLYHVRGWYYLMAAEGGTGDHHSEVIFRAKSPWGPYVPYDKNPILTQRDLPRERSAPVTNAGHADLFQAKDGRWWAVFLASRPYAGSLFNTGRETFLLPVEWQGGWPIILRKGEPVPIRRSLDPRDRRTDMIAGDLDLRESVVKRDDFDGTSQSTEWIQVHVPKRAWYDMTTRPGSLTIHALDVGLGAMRNPSFLARRQEDQTFEASTELTTPGPAVSAGLAAFQNEQYWYFFGTRLVPGGQRMFLERRAGGDRKDYASQPFEAVSKLKLRISGDGGKYSFHYDTGAGWQPLREDDDGSILSTEKAGGFVGTVLGPYARQD